MTPEIGYVVVEIYGTPGARIWQYTYDSLGRLTLSVTLDDLEIHYGQDVLGRVLTESSYSGVNLLVQTEYELPGHWTNMKMWHRDVGDSSVGDNGYANIIYIYTDSGNVTMEAMEGDTTSYTYDTAMRVASVTSASGDVVVYTYDDNSNVIMVEENAVDTSGGSSGEFYTHYAYDELNRLVEVEPDENVNPNNSTRETVYAYDSLNQLVTETDAATPSHVTRNVYDPLGRVISIVHDVDALNATVDYTYDANGRLETQSDAVSRPVTESEPRGNITRYAYDALDRLRLITHPDGTTTQYTDYDVLGNLYTAVDPDGLVTHTDYDIMGRPVTQSHEHLAGRVDPGTTTCTYDALGRVIEAGNDVSTVTHTYDTLGNLQSETSWLYGANPRTIDYVYDNRSLQTAFEVEGSLQLNYTHYDVGQVMDINQDTVGTIAHFDYLGDRMLKRQYGGNVTNATATYEPTGRRIHDITHTDVNTNIIDKRTYTWSGVYNLDSCEITDSPLASTENYSYDGLHRNISPGNLDAVGNRLNTDGYTMTGVDAAMNRYTTVGADTWYYSPWGGLQSIAQTKTYTYDVQNRLKEYSEIELGEMESLGALNPGTPPEWPLKIGNWKWDTNYGYLYQDTEDTSSGCILYVLSDTAPGLTVEYLSTHDPDDPDGDTDTQEFRTDDYTPKYYAQILLSVDTSAAPDDYPYLALRITPDQLALIEYDGTTVTALDTIDVECSKDTWYTVWVEFDDSAVTCTSRAAGAPVATLTGTSTIFDNLDGVANTVGFTVGGQAEYHFRALGYVTAQNTTKNYVKWDYDPYGRKIARTQYDNDGSVDSQIRYVYDGWQLAQEIDALTDTVIAEYVYGPGYVDDVVQSRHDLDFPFDGMQPDETPYYHHTDQQYSTVAVTDAGGNVVERYGYDAFGNPTIYDGSGTPLTTGSAIGNSVLYTGRTWQPELGLYDYRNRQYDPTTGRFTTPDPLGAHGDWNNLGNAYTYVGNNPGRYLDPLGLEGIEYDLMSKPIPGSNARAYIRMLSNREDPLVTVVETVVRGGAAFYDGALPGTDFTDSYDPNLAANIAMNLVGGELSPVNLIFAGSINHVAGALFSKGNFIMNRVFRNTEGLWVDKLGNPLTGTLRHEGRTLNLFEGLADAIVQRSDGVISYSLQGQKLGCVASSRVLAYNLEIRGVRRPQGLVAHHIVAGNDKRAARARSILERNGIDINEAVNGVFLPPQSAGLDQSAHGHLRLHTKRYYDQITSKLMQAKPGKLRDMLANIAENLQNGTFSF